MLGSVSNDHQYLKNVEPVSIFFETHLKCSNIKNPESWIIFVFVWTGSYTKHTYTNLRPSTHHQTPPGEDTPHNLLPKATRNTATAAVLGAHDRSWSYTLHPKMRGHSQQYYFTVK